jgi:uncharacterized protein with GYD domain
VFFVATFVVLAQFTEQGLRNIREFPQRARNNQQQAQSAGLTIKAAYVTEGEYDQVIIFDAPDEKVGVAGLVALLGQGNIRTRTMRAHSVEEFEQILAQIPS